MIRSVSILVCFLLYVAVNAMPEKYIRGEINLLDKSLTESQKREFMGIISNGSLSERQTDDKIDEFIATLNDTQQEWYKTIKQRQQLSAQEDKAFRLERIAEMPQSLQKIANEIEKIYDNRDIPTSDKKAKIKEMKQSLPVEIRDELFPVYANHPLFFVGFFVGVLIARG